MKFGSEHIIYGILKLANKYRSSMVQHGELRVGESQDITVCPKQQGQKVAQDDVGRVMKLIAVLLVN